MTPVCCDYKVNKSFFKGGLLQKNMLELNLTGTGYIFLLISGLDFGQPYSHSASGLKGEDCFCYTGREKGM